MPVVIPPGGESPSSPPPSPERPVITPPGPKESNPPPTGGVVAPPVSTATGLPADIIQSLSVSGVGSLAMQPSILASLQLSNLIQNTNQSQQNAVSFQQTLNGVQVTVLGKVVNMLTAVGPLEAASVSMLFSGNAVASQLAALRAMMRLRRR